VKKRNSQFFIFSRLLLLGVSFYSGMAHAENSIEVSVGFSYTRSTYSEGNFNSNRRLGGSIGYNFFSNSSIELAFQDVVDRTFIAGYEDTRFHDRVYSANWVQGLVSRDFPVQPYVKGGVGQLNREADGKYSNGSSPPAKVDSLSAVMGAGLRIYFTRQFAIRSEVTSYLTGAKIATWRDNIGYTVGLSLMF
jgi:hypothetical protein